MGVLAEPLLGDITALLMRVHQHLVLTVLRINREVAGLIGLSQNQDVARQPAQKGFTFAAGVL